MRFLRRSLIGLFLVSLTLALFVAAGVRLSTTIAAKRAEESVVRPARERQFAVNVVTAEAIETTPILSTFGEIRARRTLELRVPSGGRIVEMSENFEEGGIVTAGEVILRLDPTEAESALRVAEADLRESQAELEDAGRALELAKDDLAAGQAQLELRIAARERQESLSSRGVGSASAVETAALSEAAARQAVLSRRQALANSEAALAAAQTAVLRSEIAKADAERALDDMVVVADFGGILTEVSGALGALVGGNEQIGTLIAPGDLEVAFRISTEQYSRLIDATGRVPPR
ncbi:HlyD family secretion protein, partial [Celeribacter arenosi]